MAEVGRPATTLKKSYISSLGVVDTSNIDKFVILASRRMLRKNQVKRILLGLKRGIHFESPVVVNEVGKKWRIIDGNHRVEALRMYFGLYPGKNVEVNFAVYKDLTEAEEKEVFRIWNMGTKQTPDDYLQVHANEIPILEKIRTSFPVKTTLYIKEGCVKVSNLLRSYLGCLKLKQPTLYTTSGPRFIEMTKTLESKDYRWLVRFVENMKGKVGTPDKTNPWYKPALLVPLMRIVFDNPMIEDEFWAKRFDKLVNSYQIKSLANGQSKDVQIIIHKVMLEILNIGRTTKTYVLSDNNPSSIKKEGPIVRDVIKQVQVGEIVPVDEKTGSLLKGKQGKRTWQPWDKKSDAQLITLFGKKSVKEIAKIMVRTGSSIYNRCVVLGITK